MTPKKIENIMGKEKNADDPSFSPFPTISSVLSRKSLTTLATLRCLQSLSVLD